MTKEYEHLIQERLNKEFNIIVRVAMVIAFAAGFMLYISSVSKVYAIVNFVAGFLLLAFSIFPTKIPTSYKIILLTIITGVIALFSFIGGGFTSSFITLLLLANVLAVLFLKSKSALIISLISIGVMIGLGIYSSNGGAILEIKDYMLTWGLQLVSFVLFLVVLNKSVNTIKKYLFENIEGLEKSLDHINQLAYYDRLTGLPNVYKFGLDIEKQIEEHKRNGFIVIINLKSLSMINSTLGYATGDQALKDVKDVFLRIKKDGEVVARTGGNEFSIWIEGVSDEELQWKASLIMDELKKQSVIRKKKFEFFSAYAEFIYGEESFEDCYQKATLTLTHVKSKKIYELTAYNDQIEQTLLRKEKLKDHIEDAMLNGDITLFYQKKVDSRTGEIIGVEALARWRNEELGMISPVEFIPLIESVNMSREFGIFVIRRACKDFDALQKKYNEKIKVSINISPSHIKDDSIIQTIKEALEEYQIPDNRIVVEITENILIREIAEVKGILRKLKELHIEISLDDFGTGYSSLNYLAQLELDEMKIDKTFIDQIEYSKSACILLDNIIQLSEKFNLKVIAEGVETKAQCDILADLGCYFIQGFYFAKPESIEEENK